jgi:hypothetical protein
MFLCFVQNLLCFLPPTPLPECPDTRMFERVKNEIPTQTEVQIKIQSSGFSADQSFTFSSFCWALLVPAGRLACPPCVLARRIYRRSAEGGCVRAALPVDPWRLAALSKETASPNHSGPSKAVSFTRPHPSQRHSCGLLWSGLSAGSLVRTFVRGITPLI